MVFVIVIKRKLHRRFDIGIRRSAAVIKENNEFVNLRAQILFTYTIFERLCRIVAYGAGSIGAATISSAHNIRMWCDDWRR